MSEPSLPTAQDVQAAAIRLKGQVRRTPVFTSSTLDNWLQSRIHFKCEQFQRMGAFKIRGALNALMRLDASARQRGVVAYSSGNHAQGIALAARELGIPAVIVMPSDAWRSPDSCSRNMTTPLSLRSITPMSLRDRALPPWSCSKRLASWMCCSFRSVVADWVAD